ncbi:LiaF domain-containing protein [Anaerotalea alkaliphila]|uniref:Cell wall-active antibiotics response protein n=1 Tax=Anaerotalea alkaliphila TaxID=2662126 RepID=A0A7X5KMG4_9FIRM|nr:LiaF domain-containing protein [Anaerotalea alkaliphila]NDL66929.1 cell wall-active antibiotics response protein [Anaerotalea alkaliphila]
MRNKRKMLKYLALGAVFGLVGKKVYHNFEELRSVYNHFIFGKSERIVYDDEFDGDSMSMLCSDIEIDLTNTNFFEEEMYLDLQAVASRVKILIPSHVEVVLEGSCKFSKVRMELEEAQKREILHIHYHLTASSMEIDAEESECCQDPWKENG